MSRAVRWGATLCALGLVVATTAPVYAQGAEGTQGAPQGQTPANPPPGQDPAKPDGDDQKKAKPVGFRWNKGLSLRLGEAGHIDFKVRLQGDLQDSEGPTGDDDDPSFDFARRRVGIEGELFDLIEFQVERELTGDEPWRDVYVNVRPVTSVQFQGGHFKLPFSLDQNTGSTNLDFVYRSLAARQLAPGRDPGVMVHGRVLPRRVLRYEAGVFSDDGRNARTNNPDKVWGGKTIAGRVAVQPWRTLESVLEDLQVGVAATRSDVPEGIPSLRGQAVLGAVFYDPETPVLGLRRRTGVEARWRPGPFSLKSEYMRVTTAREGQSVESTDLSPLLGSGWYVSGTWALTGERKASGLDEPRRPLFQGGIGAIELAARTEALDFRSTGEGEAFSGPRADVIPPIADRVFTFGINWYLNRYLKVQANVVRESFSDAERSPTPGDPVIVSTLLRVQLTL
ncbi:Phosphate-selective porin [Luteitalea pratensis]|uniref:Phosphate-selective porin n=1 Tax=Luteitalea pratensis TaxID=1855912 RepID=A0A143PIP6_LUTPR|nr:porin [Luteitalea pratensis]AMY08276.1 Phosphate-selective porin [Luteitalea pratensis]